MSISTVQQLDTFGPERCDTLSVEQARAMCLRLAGGRYENFSVLSAVVPPELKPDFASVYAFCRWADDLGDEVGDATRSLELLAWWRRELQQCFEGKPRHPVFLALHPTIERHNLPFETFDNLIRAFEQDQTVSRYQTWEELLGYCRCSADPVGRLVLMICGEPRTDELFGLSDRICTALQLTNHWQDVRRDILERDRIYLPREIMDRALGLVASPMDGHTTSNQHAPDRHSAFESRLIASARQGWGVDQRILDESRRVIRACVEQTWSLYEEGLQILDRLGPRTRPIVWLLAAGGQRVLRLIEMWNYETAINRPRLSKPAKLGLVAQAWWMSVRARKRPANAPSPGMVGA